MAHVVDAPDRTSLVLMAVWALVLLRSGILGGAIAFAIYGAVNDEYLTTHLGAWYAGVTISTLILVGALLAWGLAAALRGRDTSAVA